MMRLPQASVNIKILAAVDLANIFYLEQWGTQEEKQMYLSEKSDTPVILGPTIEMPLDFANLQDSTGNGFITSKAAISLLSLIVVYKGLVLPMTRGKTITNSIPGNSRKRRKKRSSLTNIIQEYINPWIMAGLEDQPRLTDILTKLGVPERKCQDRLVCQAFTYLPHLPHGIRDLLVVLSKRMVDLPDYELAIVYGLGGGGCDLLHVDLPPDNCPDPIDLVNQFLHMNAASNSL
ncbi:unnamed protein product [Meganyctiphanes norvegica]|uniref:Uncharacterized protein n=1 Tax=Meganyctiphanes norvegica TaxID=48144 RepID=A0AAV2Q8Z4_MEGNR